MAASKIDGINQIQPGTITRGDLNTATSGSAVTAKVIAGTGIAVSSTGADSGTGDVTVSVNSATGTTTVNFGTAASGGGMSATVNVTGQANIVAGSAVDAWIVATATSDHSADEHVAESINVLAGSIQPGTGFTIYAVSLTVALFGAYTVSWSWN